MSGSEMLDEMSTWLSNNSRDADLRKRRGYRFRTMEIGAAAGFRSFRRGEIRRGLSEMYGLLSNERKFWLVGFAFWKLCQRIWRYSWPAFLGKRGKLT
jgi:hypothetical protein